MFKKLALLFTMLTAFPLLTFGDAGVHYFDIALSGSGKPIANAPVRVCYEPAVTTNPCTPLAVIYSNVGLTSQKSNPFTADALGNFDFYVDSSAGLKFVIEVSCQPGISGCGPQGSVSITRNVCIFCGETMQKNGSFVATQPIFNFIEGANITLTAEDDPVNNRANLIITASGGAPGTLSCDPTTVVDIYVDTTGSDVTGDGTIGNPYATIQHAIDTDVPTSVGAKYYIHLISPGTYTGDVLYSSRVDCAGGITCGSSPPDTPFGTGLAIIGSTDGVNSDSWIIAGGIIVDGLKLYLQGMKVTNGAIGIIARNHAQLAVSAVHVYNNHLGLLGATWSQIYVIPGTFVENDAYTLLATVENFNASSDGIEVTEDSVLTDTCPDGDNPPLGTNTGCVTLGTGRFLIACIEAKKGQLYMRDDVTVDFSAGGNPVNGLQILDGHFALARYSYTGHGSTGTGIKILSGRMSGAAFGGGVYNINTAATGIVFGEGGEITEPITFVSVTKEYSSTYDSTKAGTNFVGYGGTVKTATFSGTPTFNMFDSTTHKITLTGNVTASTFTNGTHGMTLTMQICQDAMGGRTFAWDANVLGADTIGVVASKCNVQRFMYDGVATKWYAIAPMQKDM